MENLCKIQLVVLVLNTLRLYRVYIQLVVNAADGPGRTLLTTSNLKWIFKPIFKSCLLLCYFQVTWGWTGYQGTCVLVKTPSIYPSLHISMANQIQAKWVRSQGHHLTANQVQAMWVRSGGHPHRVITTELHCQKQWWDKVSHDRIWKYSTSTCISVIFSLFVWLSKHILA